MRTIKTTELYIVSHGQFCFAYNKDSRSVSMSAMGKFADFRVPHPVQDIKDFVRGLRRFSPLTQYYWFSSTDCDHMHVEYAVKYPNGWTAEDSINNAYDNAEGPTSFYPMTRAEYEEYKNERVSDDIAARQAGY